jgi:hypothetical protein
VSVWGILPHNKVDLHDVIIVDDIEHAKLGDGVAYGIGIEVKIRRKSDAAPAR